MFDGREPGDAGLGRDVRAVTGRDPGADAVRSVRPAVIGADEVVVFHPAQGERRAAMDAQVPVCADLAGESDDHDRLVEQPSCDRAIAELVGPEHWMPVPTKRAVQRRLAGPVQHVLGHIAASAKPAMSGNDEVRDGVSGWCRAAAGRSCRRSIQTVVMPSDLAGTWSWNRLWATWRIRSRGTSMRSNASSKLASLGLVAPGLFGRDDPVERDPELPVRCREQVVVAVRDDAEAVARLQPSERRRRVRERRPVDDGAAERAHLLGRRFDPVGPAYAAQADAQHVPVEEERTRFGTGFEAGYARGSRRRRPRRHGRQGRCAGRPADRTPSPSSVP